MMSFVYVFIGGGLGSICRYGISQLAPQNLSYKGTFVANVLACMILGLLIGLNSKGILSTPNRLLLATGFCGGFSTFSTFSGELFAMIQEGQTAQAIGYAVISIISGILFIALGIWISKYLQA